MKLKWTHKGEIEYECEKAEARGKAHGYPKLIDEYLKLHPTSPASV